MYLIDIFRSRPNSLYYRIRLIGNVHQTDIVALAVSTAQQTLVCILEPGNADKSRMREPVFSEVPESYCSLFLICYLHKSGSHTSVNRAKVELSVYHRHINSCHHSIKILSVGRKPVCIESEYV